MLNFLFLLRKIKNENEALQQQVKKLQDEIKEKEICITQQTKQTEELMKESHKGSHSQWYEDDGTTTTKVISDNFKKLEILNVSSCFNWIYSCKCLLKYLKAHQL